MSYKKDEVIHYIGSVSFLVYSSLCKKQVIDDCLCSVYCDLSCPPDVRWYEWFLTCDVTKFTYVEKMVTCSDCLKLLKDKMSA